MTSHLENPNASYLAGSPILFCKVLQLSGGSNEISYHHSFILFIAYNRDLDFAMIILCWSPSSTIPTLSPSLSNISPFCKSYFAFYFRYRR